jgi:integrase
MRGAPAPAIQKLAGHRDLMTTQRYVHLTPAAIESAIRLLELPTPVADRGNSGATEIPAAQNY